MASSTWRVNNSTALGGEVCAPWQANHAYATGARCVCTSAYATVAARAVVFECTDDGTSHATTQPTWDYTVGNTTSDGTVTWTARSPSDGTWNNASCILYYALNHAAADGDTIYVDDGHSETLPTSDVSFEGSITANTFIYLYCVDKSDDSLSTGALIYGTRRIYFKYFLYSYGITYHMHASSIYEIGAIGTTSYPTYAIIEGDNTLVLKSSNTLGPIVTGNAGSSVMPSVLEVRNGNIEINDKDVTISVSGGGKFLWRGGKFVGTEGSVALLSANIQDANVEVQDVDLEDVGNGEDARYLVESVDNIDFANFTFTRCKLPSDAGFAVVASFANLSTGKVSLRHCSAADKYYDFHEQSYCGLVEDNTSIYRTDGASDGTTSISCKMVSTAGCLENIVGLESIKITGWTSSTTEKTFTIEFVHDSATALQNDEIWMELEYPANNTDGLGAIAKSKCLPLGTPADTTDSSETWTTTGLSNPNTRKLSVTVTPGKAGPICARVYLAKASTTVYIDPMITES